MYTWRGFPFLSFFFQVQNLAALGNERACILDPGRIISIKGKKLISKSSQICHDWPRQPFLLTVTVPKLISHPHELELSYTYSQPCSKVPKTAINENLLTLAPLDVDQLKA